MGDWAPDDDLDLLVSAHRRELMAASAESADLDLAFRLQMEEARTASLALVSSSSRHSPPRIPAAGEKPSSSGDGGGEASDDELAQAMALQAFELERFHQEKRDSEQAQAELRRVAADIRLRDHDERLAREIDDMPDDEWEYYGDNVERPIEMENEQPPFRLYFKGMAAREEARGGASVHLAAIGVAVCDPEDKLLLKIQKPIPPLASTCRELLEIKALIEGLNAAASLGIKRINVFCDFRPLYNHVLGKWRVKQRKVANIISQVLLLQRKFERCQMFLLPRCHVRFVFQLARDVIDSQLTRNVQLDGSKTLKETCNICLEDTDSSQMFAVDGCLHRFCFSCMIQHIEVKLLHGMLPGCPHDGCNIKLNVESSRKFLSPRLLDIMVQRIREASIPATEKIYCPYPKCSALMSISEAILPKQDSSSKQVITPGLRKCIKCDKSFCINCKVPWHEGMSCYDYKRLNPHPRPEDRKLHNLARQKLWRQCVKCNNMIELAEGCFHMTCRCGYEFCYTCGAEWKDKKATCSCPLWDEGYIWYDESEEESEDFYDDEEDDDYSFDDEEDDFIYGYHRH